MKKENLQEILENPLLDILFNDREKLQTNILKSENPKYLEEISKIENDIGKIIENSITDKKTGERLFTKIEQFTDIVCEQNYKLINHYYKIGFLDGIKLTSEVKSQLDLYGKIDLKNDLAK